MTASTWRTTRSKRSSKASICAAAPAGVFFRSLTQRERLHRWMRKHTPSLFPWVNQCGDGTEWLARAGTPYAVPELYSVAGTSGNATAMAMAQLGGYDSWIGESQRFGKLKIKLHVHYFAGSGGHSSNACANRADALAPRGHWRRRLHPRHQLQLLGAVPSLLSCGLRESPELS